MRPGSTCVMAACFPAECSGGSMAEVFSGSSGQNTRGRWTSSSHYCIPECMESHPGKNPHLNYVLTRPFSACQHVHFRRVNTSFFSWSYFLVLTNEGPWIKALLHIHEASCVIDVVGRVTTASCINYWRAAYITVRQRPHHLTKPTYTVQEVMYVKLEETKSNFQRGPTMWKQSKQLCQGKIHR